MMVHATAQRKKLILFEGDSITAAAGGYPMLYRASGPIASALINAVSGSTTTTLVNRAAALDTKLSIPATKHILSVLIGLNDYVSLGSSTATFLAALASYLDARRTAGWYVVVCTLLPASDAGFNAWRAIVNPEIRLMVGTHADALCDFAADATMGPDAACANGTYYEQVYGEHPTDAGHAVLQPIIATVLNGIT